MLVQLLITGGTALLIGKGYGADGEDLVFAKGTEADCRDAARARRLNIDEMERTPYYRTFKKTDFECGDLVSFVHVEINQESYTISDPRVVEMKLNANIGTPRVHSGNHYALKDAKEEVGLFQMSSQAGFHKTGSFYCSAKYPSDVTKMMANVHVWVEKEYERMLGEANKMANNFRMNKMSASKQLSDYARKNKELLNKVN